MTVRSLACVLAGLLAPGLAHAAPPRYSLTWINPGDAGWVSWPYALNDRGEVAGFIDRSPSGSPDIPDRPFVWSGPGTLRELPLPKGTDFSVQARSINNRGEVLGQIGGDIAIWSPDGGLRTIAPPAGQIWSVPRVINDAGTVLTEVWENGRLSTAVRRRADGTIDATASLFRPGPWSAAMNASGDVAGFVENDQGRRMPAVWEADGTVRTLTTPRGGGQGYAINDGGLVAGTWGDEGVSGVVIASGVWRPDGSFVQIPLMPGVDVATQEPFGINSRGQVVGQVSLTNHSSDAYYWSEADGLHDLQSLLDASGAGWDLLWAFDINEAGQIIAIADFQGGGFQGVLLTPVPEPSLPAAGTFIAAAVTLRRFRRR